MNSSLEMLVATQERTNPDFLSQMFPYGWEDFGILIVNQSETGKKIPETDLPDNIRVINQTGKGLSRSRNTAIRHARGNILMLADDDVVYEEGFHKKVLEIHGKYNSPVIFFPLKDEAGRLFGHYKRKDYPVKNFKHIYSPQISFKRDAIRAIDIPFDERFGLGAPYPDSENFIWLTRLHRKGIKMLYAGSVEAFMMHPSFTSSHILHTDEKIRTRLMMMKELYGAWAYFYYFKLIFFLWRKGYVPFDAFWEKWKLFRK